MSPTFSFKSKTIKTAEISVGLNTGGGVENIRTAEVLDGVGPCYGRTLPLLAHSGQFRNLWLSYDSSPRD